VGRGLISEGAKFRHSADGTLYMITVPIASLNIKETRTILCYSHMVSKYRKHVLQLAE